jgi:hypothetical protein
MQEFSTIIVRIDSAGIRWYLRLHPDGKPHEWAHDKKDSVVLTVREAAIALMVLRLKHPSTEFLVETL